VEEGSRAAAERHALKQEAERLGNAMRERETELERARTQLRCPPQRQPQYIVRMGRQSYSLTRVVGQPTRRIGGRAHGRRGLSACGACAAPELERLAADEGQKSV
jgi:hypothetical protein